MKHTRLFLSLFILIFLSNSSFALGNEFTCGADLFLPKTVADMKRLNDFNDQIYQTLQSHDNARTSTLGCANGGPVNGRVYTLPVVFHIIDSSTNGSTIATNAQIAQALKNLNDQWRRVTGDGVDMQIQFAMAQRDPWGNPTNGINRVSGRNATGYLQYGLDVSKNSDQVLSLGNWPSSQYINIYIVTKLVGASGMAALPGPGRYQGIFLINTGIFTNGNSGLTHEMGHYMGLFHTFETVFNTTTNECPDDDDCTKQGDLICDTRPHKLLDCISTNCPGSGSFDNSRLNYMSYCGPLTRFTQGQKDRVRAVLFNEYRIDLLRSYALIPTTVSLEVALDSVYYTENLAEPLCNHALQPKLRLKNLGTTTVTSVKIAASLAGNVVSTGTYPVSIPSKGSQVVTVPSFNFTTGGEYDVSFQILQVNTSRIDADTLNNQLCTSVTPIIVADTLFVTADPPAGGIVSGTKIFTCGYSTDTITVVDNPGYEFYKWMDSNGTTVSMNRTYYVPPVWVQHYNQNRSFTAVFIKKQYTVSLNMNPVNGGTVTGGGAYDYQVNLTVRARSNYGYQFSHWENAGVPVSTDSNYTFSVTGNTNLVAVFAKKQFMISVIANPTAGGNPAGAGNYAYLDNATVRANKTPGYKFLNWKEGTNIVSTDSVFTFSVNKSRNLTANYALVTGIKQTTLNEISKIYPNPANTILQLEIQSKQNSSITLNIIDMKGSLLDTKIISTTKGILSTTFDVSKLAAGNYLLNLYDEEGMASYLFVVQ